MANVYRQGTKSVHIGTRRRPGMDVEQVIGCNLDPGGQWLPVPPPGRRCPDCFGGPATSGGSRKPGKKAATLAGTAAALVLVAAALASPDMNLIPVYFDGSPSPSVMPGPSVVTPVPTETPAITPAPTFGPAPTVVVPTLGPLPTYPPAPTYPPLPTWPPFPALPTLAPLPTLPILKVCVHPGTHLGVDPCRWPHN